MDHAGHAIFAALAPLTGSALYAGTAAGTQRLIGFTPLKVNVACPPGELRFGDEPLWSTIARSSSAGVEVLISAKKARGSANGRTLKGARYASITAWDSREAQA